MRIALNILLIKALVNLVKVTNQLDARYLCG